MSEIDDSEKFRKEIYDVFDDKARYAVRRWIDSQGLYTLSVEDYGADIKVARIVDGIATITRHELEVREPWDEEIFPYDTVTIPHRKAKLLNRSDNGDSLFFWTINKFCTKGMYVSAKVVRTCPVIRKLTTRGEGNFFSVPLCKYKVVDLV